MLGIFVIKIFQGILSHRGWPLIFRLFFSYTGFMPIYTLINCIIDGAIFSVCRNFEGKIKKPAVWQRLGRYTTNYYVLICVLRLFNI